MILPSRFAGVIVAGVVSVLAATPAPGSEINQAAAVLVFPEVINETTGTASKAETFLSITNLSDQSVVARVFFVVGASCSSCSLGVPLSPSASRVIVASRDTTGTQTTLRAADTGATTVCPGGNGFAVVSVENPGGATITDNILSGDSFVVDYITGEAGSASAISMLGFVQPCRRCLTFDGEDFQRFPSVVGGQFIAPDYLPGGLEAKLTLFTLGFQSGTAPFVDCSLTGFDAFGYAFTTGLQFGCWTQVDLAAIDPGFAFPFFGVFGSGQEHGWLELVCVVNGVTGAQGGVHGVLSQRAPVGAIVRRQDATSPQLSSAASWSHLLIESVTVGDSVEFCDAEVGLIDTDGDGVGDGCDLCLADPLNDSDHDGLCGNVDNCPLVANATQVNADGDAFGDACDPCALDPANDQDLDGSCGNLDNCAAVPNADQMNADFDARGDACDTCASDPLDDGDGDGICGELDNCPGVSNATQANADGDAYGDGCDPCPLIAGSGCDPDNDGDGTPNASDPDDDSDGVLDEDGDGQSDPCADGNRLGCDDNCPFDFNVTQRDRDDDGIGDACDPTDELVQGGAASKSSGGPGLSGETSTYVFAWEPESGASSYNVYRGLLSALAADVYGSCYRNRIATRFTILPEEPVMGTGFSYLVTAVYAGHEGSLGDRSDGTERPLTSACP